MKLLFVFHSIYENSGMENLLLDIKDNSNLKITVVYDLSVSKKIKDNFICFKSEEIEKKEIEKNKILIYFKEYGKQHKLDYKKYKNIKKICAVFEPIHLSENIDSYNFHLASCVVTNYKTNIKKINTVTDLPKFHIHNGLDFSKIEKLPIINKKIGLDESFNQYNLKKLERIFANLSLETVVINNSNLIDCEYVIMNEKNLCDKLNYYLYQDRKIITKFSHFSNEFDMYSTFIYKSEKNLYDYFKNNKEILKRSHNIQELADIKIFVLKLKEIIYYCTGFCKTSKKISYFDSGSLVTNNWSFVDDSLNKTLDSGGLRFFSFADRELKLRPDTLKKWAGILHNEPIEQDLNAWNTCQGIFVFSKKTEDKIKKINQNICTKILSYPILRQQEKFFLDWFLHNKIICSTESLKNIPNGYKNITISKIDDIDFRKNIVYIEFDTSYPFEILTKCIESNTPVILKKNEITIEYLGEDYPLFLQNIELLDENKIVDAYEYIKKLNKKKFRIRQFIKSITSSNCYNNLPEEKTRPLLRMTLGRTSKDGYEISYYNLKSIIKCYGEDKFDICICHNKLTQERLTNLEEKWQNIKTPLKFYKQKNCELPLTHKFERHTDATTHHHISSGSFWKICPPRIRPHSHELILDNDIIFLNKLPEIETFLQNNMPMTLEDSSVHMGYYEFMRDFKEDIALNSGIIGLPPNFNFEKKLTLMWETKKPSRSLNGGDEQGLITTILSKGDHILIPRNHVIGLHPEKLHINSFSSGTPSYQILKTETERDFISYFRVDIDKLSKKAYALHFYQINRSSVRHKAWEKFLNYYRYMQSPKSLK